MCVFHTPFILFHTCSCPDLYTMLTSSLLIFPFSLSLPSTFISAMFYYPHFPKATHSQLVFLHFCYSQDSKLNIQNEKLKTRINIWGKSRSASCAYSTSLKTFLSVFIYLTEEFIISHSFTDEFNSTVHMYYIFIICQLTEHLVWFHFLVIVNRTALEPVNSSTKKVL